MPETEYEPNDTCWIRLSSKGSPFQVRVVEKYADGLYRVETADSDETISFIISDEVMALAERADSPGKDSVGTVRRHFEQYWVKLDQSRWYLVGGPDFVTNGQVPGKSVGHVSDLRKDE